MFGVALALGLSSAIAADDEAAPASAESVSVTAHYSGSVMIFQVADISISGQFTDHDYTAAARFTAAGLAALFTDADIEAGVSGYREGSALRPWRYSHLNHASSKNRVVGIDFPEGVAMPDINPPFGNMGEPPATDEERAGASDPLSALLSMALGAASGENGVCDGRLPVFDGRARYNLRFEPGGTDTIRTRAWRGEAVVCHAYYEPISGYEADEFPSEEDISHPITFWLAPLEDGRIHLPVRIRTNAGFGGVTVQARSIETH
nr:DUF3108 domain-containing protein [Maricaulis parjimensis]